MKTYQVEQFELITRRAFNRVLLPKISPELNVTDARVFFNNCGQLMIRDRQSELVFSDISMDSLRCVKEAGGVHVMNPAVDIHPKLIHIPLGEKF